MIFILCAFMLCACSARTPGGEIFMPPPAQADQQATPSSPSPSIAAETPTPSPDDTPAIRVSNMLEENCTVIAERDYSWTLSTPEYDVYLYADRPVYNVFVSNLYECDEDAPTEYVEVDGFLFVPELSAGQAVQIRDPYPQIVGASDNRYIRISYTNGDGAYASMLLLGEKEGRIPSLSPTQPSLKDQVYDSDYLRADASDPFYSLMIAGAFTEYIPKGFCIAKGSLGDVNNDGIEDALVCLTTDGYRIGAYEGVMPLFVLIGQPSGGYIVEKKIAKALFTPYRSSSRAVAGNGYIDIIYDWVGGAACHHTQACRFAFAPDKNDWLLKDYSYQPSYTLDYTEELPPQFVSPLPDFNELPIGEFTNGELYESAADWDSFDLVCELSVRSWGEFNDIYTLAVKLNETDETYEGYIYKYYELSEYGSFIQTVFGKYNPDGKLGIASNEATKSFVFQGEAWVMDEHDEDSFHLASGK